MIKYIEKSLDVIKCGKNITIMARAGVGKTEILAQKAFFILETGLCSWS